MKKRGQGQTINVVVAIVLALILLAIGIFLANKYVLGGSKQIVQLGECESQPNAECSLSKERTGYRCVKGFGCKGSTKDESGFCCFKET